MEIISRKTNVWKDLENSEKVKEFRQEQNVETMRYWACILGMHAQIQYQEKLSLKNVLFLEAMSVGHSTRDALRILHDELTEVVRAHEAQVRITTRRNWSWLNFLHHYNKESPIHWTSVVVLILMSALLITAYSCQNHW